MLLAFLSIAQDWRSHYNLIVAGNTGIKFIPVFNTNFLSSMILVISFGLINYINIIRKNISSSLSQKSINSIIEFSIPTILITILYFSFRMEIAAYWQQLYNSSEIAIHNAGQDYPDRIFNDDILKFKTIWIFNYSMLFLSLLSFVNLTKIKNKYLGFISLGLNMFVTVLFLAQALYIFSELRESYLNQSLAEYYHRTYFNIGIRYVSFGFVGLILISTYLNLKREFLKTESINLKTAFDFLLHGSLLWITSSELISLIDVMKSTQSYKLGLSILWGVYALILIVLGIWMRKKHLRIGAIVLFAVTLIKLFFYDISHLETIAKTIIFVLLGVFLLIISFLYNKYKHIISGENEN
jgi:hypothetical protein